MIWFHYYLFPANTSPVPFYLPFAGTIDLKAPSTYNVQTLTRYITPTKGAKYDSVDGRVLRWSRVNSLHKVELLSAALRASNENHTSTIQQPGLYNAHDWHVRGQYSKPICTLVYWRMHYVEKKNHTKFKAFSVFFSCSMSFGAKQQPSNPRISVAKA